MLHSNVGQTNFIGMIEVVYQTSPIGNLEGFLVRRILPLQQGFDCDTIGVLRPIEHQNRYGNDLNCKTNCPVDRNTTLTEQLSNYTPEERIMLNRIHGAYDEQFKFAMDGHNIMRGNGAVLNDYRMREFATQPFKNILGIDFRQMRLSAK